MTDLVERLRGGVYGTNRIALCKETAADLSALRAERDALTLDVIAHQQNVRVLMAECHALRKALEAIKANGGTPEFVYKTARAALKGE